jgi:spermidine synthase
VSVATLQVLAALLFPATILAVRASRMAFQTVPGELLGPGPMFLTSLVVLSLFCAVSGWLFAAGSRLYAERIGCRPGQATGAVYLVEAAGSGAGGILASLVLLRYLSAFEIAALVGTLNILSATLISRRRILALLVLGMLPVARLDGVSLGWLWRGFHLVESRNSVYGNLAVIATEGNRSLYENGLLVATTPDPAAAEEAVHFALLEHPSPRSLLMIGGGINGSIQEARKHPGLERLDYVELDPAILALFPVTQARVHNTDGRLFLKTTNDRYDVILVNLPDPQTAQLNRYYTLEFFQEAARKLAPGGVFSFQLRGSEDYTSPQLAEFLRCINKTLRQVFPQVVVIPGESVHFFAAMQPGTLTADPRELISRLRARRIETSYVREYYIPFRMTAERMAELDSEIRPKPDTPVNRDFAPIAYYFDVTLWSTQFNQAYRKLFQAVAQVPFGPVAAGVGLLALGFAAFFRERVAEICVAATGFTVIGLEMLLLLGFQAIYGYVYQELAALIAALMVGMAVGTGLRPVQATDRSSVATLQALAAASGLLLYAGFHVNAPFLFPVMAALCGMLGGAQFAAASRIYFGQKERENLGALYALDLAGSCVGALVFSAWLIPVFGFLKTAALMAIVNCGPALLALRRPPR